MSVASEFFFKTAFTDTNDSKRQNGATFQQFEFECNEQ